ncbi:ThuA domain-containing protein [Lignipirellula cremea]|nr:ThuA domain-containing protein [Lignipirellula cremea]
MLRQKLRWLLGAGLLGLTLVGATPGVAAEPEETRAKVLFVGKQPDHPYGSHMYLHTCGMLAECLTHTAGVETVVSDGWPKDPKTLQGVTTIVVYTTPGAEFLLDGPHRDQFAGMMKRGVGLVTLHWASAIRQANVERLGPIWLGVLGGTWVSNVGLHTGESRLEQLQPEHPICRGWKPYDLHDEYYLNPTITPQAAPLLQVTAKEKPVVVGWTFEREGGGRSFGTTLGHYYRNFEREPFRQMVVNGILWTAQLEVPAQGASIQVSAAKLSLPPDPAPRSPAAPRRK